MKKLFFAAIAALMTITSCNKTSDNNGYDYIYTLISGMEVINYDTNKIMTYDFEYGEYDSEGNFSEIKGGSSSNVPVLAKINIKGDATMSEVSYRYRENMTILDVTVTDNNGKERVETYRLDKNRLATEVLEGGEFVNIRNISYDDLGYRIIYDDYNLLSSDGVYNTIESRTGVETTLKYTGVANLFAMQQSSIVGAPFYLNATDHFGQQSRYLLSKATSTEDGKIVEYTYDYKVNYYGFISDEVVYKNDVKNQLTTYQYGSVMVKEEKEAEL